MYFIFAIINHQNHHQMNNGNTKNQGIERAATINFNFAVKLGLAQESEREEWISKKMASLEKALKAEKKAGMNR